MQGVLAQKRDDVVFFKKYGEKEVEVMGVSYRELDRMRVIIHMYQGVGYFLFYLRVKSFVFKTAR